MSLIFKPTNIALAAAALAVSLFWSQPAHAQQGKTLFTAKGCPTCHGPDGGAPIAPNYPKIKGQNAEYIIAQVKNFRSGERKGSLAVLMQAQAAMVSDKEVEEIAKWLSSLK